MPLWFSSIFLENITNGKVIKNKFEGTILLKIAVLVPMTWVMTYVFQWRNDISFVETSTIGTTKIIKRKLRENCAHGTSIGLGWLVFHYYLSMKNIYNFTFKMICSLTIIKSQFYFFSFSYSLLSEHEVCSKPHKAITKCIVIGFSYLYHVSAILISYQNKSEWKLVHKRKSVW